MTEPGDRMRSRVLPALLTALGVLLLAAGLLTYTSTAVADPAAPTPSATAPLPTDEPLITLPPLMSVAPSASPSAPADRVTTRVRIAALKIDLPVIAPPGDDSYPLCGVAIWIAELGQPGQGRATYLYGHAREGMLLPLLTQSKIQNGKNMIGMVVEVWTSDDQKFLYEISEVRRHETSLADAVNADHEQLWLQTSEGPHGTVGKLQVIAEPLSQEASDHASAHPKPHPVVCG